MNLNDRELRMVEAAFNMALDSEDVDYNDLAAEADVDGSEVLDLISRVKDGDIDMKRIINPTHELLDPEGRRWAWVKLNKRGYGYSVQLDLGQPRLLYANGHISRAWGPSARDELRMAAAYNTDPRWSGAWKGPFRFLFGKDHDLIPDDCILREARS